MRCLQDLPVEQDIVLRLQCAVPQLFAEQLQLFTNGRKVIVCCLADSVGRVGGLYNITEVLQILLISAVEVEVREHDIHIALLRILTDDGAQPPADLYDAQGLQHFDGLSYTALADLQFFGNLNFRGQYISGTELALHDHFFDGINHLSGKTFLWIALLFANLHTNNSSHADTLCKKWPCIKYKANWPAQSIKNFQLLLYHVRLYYTTVLFTNC